MQAYADLYNGGNTEAEIEALNNAEKKYSDYMRSGFEFLKELIEHGILMPKKLMSVKQLKEKVLIFWHKRRRFSPSKNVKVNCIPALKPLNDKIEENIYVLGANAGMKAEQWGNTCLIVRKLLNGATVDECMA